MSLKMSKGLIDQNSGDRVLVFNDRFIVRFQPKRLEADDPYMLMISSQDDWREWVSSSKCLSDYIPANAEVSYAQGVLMRGYRECIGALGIAI